jgi:hypothetical protein
MELPMTDAIASALPPFETWPSRIKALRLDPRGFPVPWFVTWFKDGNPVLPSTRDAVPDFRMVQSSMVATAIRYGWCWVCGQPLGKHLAFVIGPMCAVNRTSAEPPCHLDCAEFSARACPFMSKPRMRRNYKDRPDFQDPPGKMIERNPGVALVWVTRSFKTWRPGGRGILFEIGEPEHLSFYAHGRTATRAEIVESIESGLPILRAEAEKDGKAALDAFAAHVEAAYRLLPPG